MKKPKPLKDKGLTPSDFLLKGDIKCFIEPKSTYDELDRRFIDRKSVDEVFEWLEKEILLKHRLTLELKNTLNNAKKLLDVKEK